MAYQGQQTCSKSDQEDNHLQRWKVSDIPHIQQPVQHTWANVFLVPLNTTNNLNMPFFRLPSAVHQPHVRKLSLFYAHQALVYIIHTYIYIYIYIYVCVCVCVCVRPRARACVCIYTDICLCVYIYIYIYIREYRIAYEYMSVCVCVCYPKF